MNTFQTRLRAALALLLVGSACLFAIGSTIERHQLRHERAAPQPAKASGGESGGESSNEAGSNEAASHTEKSHAEAGVRILGIDTESVALMVVAIVVSILLALAVWLRPFKLLLLAVIGFGLVFTAGDVRELIHQLNESRTGVATIAGALIGLHLAVSALAASLLPRHGKPERMLVPGSSG